MPPIVIWMRRWVPPEFNNKHTNFAERGFSFDGEASFLLPNIRTEMDVHRKFIFIAKAVLMIRLSVVALIYHLLAGAGIISVHYKIYMIRIFDFTNFMNDQSILHKNTPSNLAYHLIQ